MSFSRGLKEATKQVWEEGYQHPFVQELGKGTLDKEKFKFYLLQDYLYLLQYAKVFALAMVKSSTEEEMSYFTKSQYDILVKEMDVHREYMRTFGITEEEIQKVKPSLYNQMYTANMLATAQTGELAEIIATIFPCAWTYADYARRLKQQYARTVSDNFYRTWIEKYASQEFLDSFVWLYDRLDILVENKTKEQREKIKEIFITSIKFEYLFWDMSYHQKMSYEK